MRASANARATSTCTSASAADAYGRSSSTASRGLLAAVSVRTEQRGGLGIARIHRHGLPQCGNRLRHVSRLALEMGELQQCQSLVGMRGCQRAARESASLTWPSR